MIYNIVNIDCPFSTIICDFHLSAACVPSKMDKGKSPEVLEDSTMGRGSSDTSDCEYSEN